MMYEKKGQEREEARKRTYKARMQVEVEKEIAYEIKMEKDKLNEQRIKQLKEQKLEMIKEKARLKEAQKKDYFKEIDIREEERVKKMIERQDRAAERFRNEKSKQAHQAMLKNESLRLKAVAKKQKYDRFERKQVNAYKRIKKKLEVDEIRNDEFKKQKDELKEIRMEALFDMER